MEKKVHQRSTKNGVRAVMLMLAFVLALAACGSTATNAVASDADADTGEADAETEPEAEEDAEPEFEEATFETLEAGTTPIEVFGGIQVELPQELELISGGGCVALEAVDPQTTSRFNPAILMADVFMSGGLVTTPISTVDEFLALYGEQPAPEPTGETMTVLGVEFDGYRVENTYADGPPPDPNFLNCTTDADRNVEFWFLPAVYADIYVAETADGLRFINAVGFTEEEQQIARELFDQIIPTITAAS